MKTKLNIIALFLLMVVTLGVPAAAQTQAPDKKRGEASTDQRPPHEPPPQAYVDCRDKKEGDKVQITTPREEKISATCTVSPKGLFARPERPPHRNMDDGSHPNVKK